MSRMKELQEKRAAAHAKAVEFLKADQTPETRTSYTAAMTEVETLGADIENIRKAEAVEAEIRAANGQAALPTTQMNNNEDPEKRYARIEREYRKAFVATIRKGTMPQNGQWTGMPDNVRKSLDAGVEYEKEFRDELTTSAGVGNGGSTLLAHIGTYSGLGFFVPTGFVNAIEQATKYFAPLLDGSVITVMDTATGQPLPFPTSNDTNNAAAPIGEAQTVTELDVTASQINFGAYKFSSGLVLCSLELLQDSAFDIEAWLIQRFAERWGRGLENYLTNGTGTNQPTGLLTAIAASGATPTIAAGSSANDGTAATGANSIGYQDYVNLEHSVDPTYRRGAKFMFHDQTLAAAKRLLDKYGRPLWQPGMASNAPDTINGYSYVINQSMPQIGASNVTIAFGDFKKFTARRVKDLAVMKLTERYAEKGEVGFVSFARIDSNLLDAGTHPINVLQQHS